MIIASQPLGMRSPTSGLDMYAFTVTILCNGHAPYQTQMGNPVPPGGIPLMFPGSNLPAKVVPEQQGQVMIDWDAAIAEAPSQELSVSGRRGATDGPLSRGT